MKMHFGTKIWIIYSVFVAFLVFMVYRSTQQKFDLVRPDYYEAELKYQDIIDASKNVNSLSQPVVITASNMGVEINIPEEAGAISKGVAEFYKPNDASQDFRVQIDSHNQTIARSLFRTGKYILKLRWDSGGKTYYKEQSLQL